MMLNSVDLPQPDGPITDRNSPGRTANDTLSTATKAPSAVSKCLAMPSTLSAGCVLSAVGIGFAAAGGLCMGRDCGARQGRRAARGSAGSARGDLDQLGQLRLGQ